MSNAPINFEKKPLFDDLSDCAWAVEYIERLAVLKIVNGRTERSFEPNSPVSREEFVKLMVLAAGLEVDDKVPQFPDVAPDGWYTPYVASAVNSGLVQGYPDGNFGIGYQITREEAAVMLSRMLNHSGYQLQGKSNAVVFADRNMITEFAVEAVDFCAQAGLIHGNDIGCFEPKRQITRAEASKLICGILDLLKEDR